jgi:hypothetical protein
VPWEVIEIAASPASFIGIVYATCERNALEAAIEEFKIISPRPTEADGAPTMIARCNLRAAQDGFAKNTLIDCGAIIRNASRGGSLKRDQPALELKGIQLGVCTTIFSMNCRNLGDFVQYITADLFMMFAPLRSRLERLARHPRRPSQDHRSCPGSGFPTAFATAVSLRSLAIEKSHCLHEQGRLRGHRAGRDQIS